MADIILPLAIILTAAATAGAVYLVVERPGLRHGGRGRGARRR